MIEKFRLLLMVSVLCCGSLFAGEPQCDEKVASKDATKTRPPRNPVLPVSVG